MIVVAGGFGIGLTMAADRCPDPGETVTGGHFRLGPGGKGSNQAVAARRLGSEVELFSCIGDDDFGTMGQSLWRREGVGADAVKTGRQPTMVGTILVDATGENRIVIAPGALDELTPDDVSGLASVMGRAEVCLVSLEIPTPVAIAVLRLARQSGATTVLDPAPAPATKLTADDWSLVDVATPNRLEAAALTGRDLDADPEVLVDRLRSVFAGTLVLTLSGDGVLLDDGRSRTWLPAAPATRVVDTTGAGDAFAGALAVALAERWPIADAVRFAAAAGAHAVEITEVVPSLPTRADLDLRWVSQDMSRRGVRT